MIIIKTKSELEIMREAGKIAAGALGVVESIIRPSITTREIDKFIHDYIISRKATPTYLGYRGFPASACISVNNEVIHGIPSGKKLLNGDIVGVDIGVSFGGLIVDTASTYPVGEINAETAVLMKVTHEALEIAINLLSAGDSIEKIMAATGLSKEEIGGLKL